MRVKILPGITYDPAAEVMHVRVRVVAEALDLDTVGLEPVEIAEILADNLYWGSKDEEAAYGLAEAPEEGGGMA